MADYLIHDSTLEDIADAIRAKTGGSALINPEDMADEIDSIQTGGGGSLPSSISKIDGGEFTLSNDTKCDTYDIATQLGTPAKGFVIWSEDLVSFETQTVKGLLSCAVNIFNFESASNTTRYGYYGYLQRQVNGSTFGAYATLSYADQPGKFTTSEKINYRSSDTYYIAGKKYKWLAWA